MIARSLKKKMNAIKKTDEIRMNIMCRNEGVSGMRFKHESK